MNANSNVGPQLINTASWTPITEQIQELHAIGVQAVMVEVGFPMLYEPFLTSQGVSYDQFVTFYQQVAASVKAAGMKLIVENDTLLSNDVQAGWNTAPFYATLDWEQYQEARAQTALTIAQVMQPDYMVVLQEPTTEANNSGQTNAATPAGSYSLLSQILASVNQAGVPGMQVGAGTGTSQLNVMDYIAEYVTLPLNFIDMHVYPINGDYLTVTLQIASAAALAGLPVTMTECWLWKVNNSQLLSLSTDQIRALNPFSFWAPLDAYFLQVMQNLAESTGMLFMDPFDSAYFAAYLEYDSSTENLTPSEILNEETSQASENLQEAMFTSTATSYYAQLVSPPNTVPPTVPTGLAGSSNNPAIVNLTWNPSSDNVGVAGYNVFRDGTQVGTTITPNYQDTGLTGGATHTYSVEAFDLGGNVSVPSLSVNVTTRDNTPPSVPQNVTPIADSSEKVTLTWSPSTDNVAVHDYLVFWGLSPVSLAQVGRVISPNTQYIAYPLSAGTMYYYGVEAEDTSGNISAMSTVVSVTMPLPPSAPANLTVTPQSTTKIALAWSTAASGGLPVTNYQVYRGNAPTGLTLLVKLSQTSYNDKSASPGTTYYYAVAAVDSGGDVSAMSPVVQTAAFALPGAPTNLTFAPFSDTKLQLTWTASASGGLPIQKYVVYRGSTATNLAQVATVQQTSYTDSSVTAGMEYYYGVVAADTAGDLSPMSAATSVTAPSPPQAPANLTPTAISGTKIGLSWSPAVSGGFPMKNYKVFMGASADSLSQIATVTTTSYTDTGLTAGNTYYYAVQAADTSGAVSPMSSVVTGSTLISPAAPTGLAVTPESTSKLSLAWLPAVAGTLPVQNYRVYRGSSPSNLAQVAMVLQTAYTDTSVTSGALYYYAVAAADTAGNLSPQSSAVAVTVPVPPQAPGDVMAVPTSAAQIGLTWSAAAGGGLPVVNYLVFRGTTPLNLAQIRSTTQTSYTDSSVVPQTTYYYAVEAVDSGGDVSPMSAAVSATTPPLRIGQQ